MASTRDAAAVFGVSQYYVWRLLHEEEGSPSYPYHLNKVQELAPPDLPARLQFCTWLREERRQILWTDESTFTRVGMFNIHNSHFWSDVNPRQVRPSHFQRRFSVNVWAGILGDQLLGSVFLDRLNTDNYLDLLQNQVENMLEYIHNAPSLAEPATPSTSMCLNVPESSQNIRNDSVGTQTRKVKMTDAEISMSLTIKKLRSKIHRTNKLRQSFKKRLLLGKQNVKNLDILKNKLSPLPETFVKMQFTQAKKSKGGRRFTLEQKILPLSLYKSSPRAYKVLSEICILPKRSTLQNLLKKICLKPGINDIIFENLKKRVRKMPASHKYCLIMFDEMAINAHLDLIDDKILGFVDDGISRKPQLADHVLVFMVRGVIKKYKQPLQYTFCTGSTKAVCSNMLKTIFNKVQSCGLKVVATVCDQGATNMAAINSLIKDTKDILKEK
ncbi:hypothetical protein evm_009949 [Chilo suppressalis]|nr:hypothetical protein evm_009949 [Chilo suppressalis]